MRESLSQILLVPKRGFADVVVIVVLAVASFAALAALSVFPLLSPHFPYIFDLPSIGIVAIVVGMPVAVSLILVRDVRVLQARVSELCGGEEVLRNVLEGNRRTLESLEKSEELFRSVASTATDAIICTDARGHVVFWNHMAEAMTGYSAEDMVGMPLTVVVAGPFKASYVAQREAGVAGESTEALGRPQERAARRKDGSEFPIELTVSSWQTREGLFFTLIVRDITERKRAEEIFRSLSDSSPIGIYIVQGGRFQFVNPQFQKYTGYSEDELLGRESLSLVLPEDKDMVVTLAKDMLAGRTTAPYEYRMMTHGGEIRWIMETVASITYRGSRAAVGNFLDITHRKELEDKLAYLATHDALSGLPNRRSLEEALVRVVAKARRGVESALLFLDLDDFKLVNDQLGHAAGDEALITVARLLQSQLRGADLLARLGGDEFAVLLENTGATEARSVAERMLTTVQEFALVIGGRRFNLSFSVGMVTIQGDQGAAALLSRADAAMYRAKEQGGHRIVLSGSEE